MPAGTLFHSEAQLGGDKRFHSIVEEIVEFGASLAPNLDGVFETGGCDQSHARALALQESIGADSCTV